jgi:hypothetical protein
LKSYKNSVIFQAFLCPTLPSERPPESVGEPPGIFNLVPANLRKEATLGYAGRFDLGAEYCDNN